MGTLEFYYHHFGIILLVQYFCILLSTFRYFSFSFQYWILSYHYLLWNSLNRVAACLDVSNQIFKIISFRSIEFAWSAHPPDGLPTVPTDLAVQKILIGIHYYQYVNTLSKVLWPYCFSCYFVDNKQFVSKEY